MAGLLDLTKSYNVPTFIPVSIYSTCIVVKVTDVMAVVELNIKITASFIELQALGFQSKKA